MYYIYRLSERLSQLAEPPLLQLLLLLLRLLQRLSQMAASIRVFVEPLDIGYTEPRNRIYRALCSAR